MQEDEFEENNAYKTLKKAILRIFGPRPYDAIDRALSRVLVGKPSQLARALVRDICKKKLQNCTCCPSIVLALWRRQLSSQVRAGIAHCEFNYDTFNAVTQLADDIHSTSAPMPTVAAVTAGQRPPVQAGLDETQPAIPYPQPEVAATSRGGRGGGRGGRGRGGRGNRGGGRGASSGGGAGHSGTKHPDLPAGEWTGCSMHFKHGRSAYFCSAPSTCPWKNIYIQKPEKNKQNQQ